MNRSLSVAFQVMFQAAGLLAMGMGVLVLAGWQLGMEPHAALGFVLAGGALWCLQPGRKSRWWAWAGTPAAAGVSLLGLVTLAEQLAGWDLGITPMSPAAALSFLFIGLALLWTARSVYQMEAERQRAEEQERKMAAMVAEARMAQSRAEELQRLVLVDPLTELLNRRGIQQALSREISWAKRHGSELLAVLLDLDDFKRINGTLGHAVGDVVLKEVGQQISHSIRATDYAGRLGSDEFLILLPKTSAKEAVPVGEKIRLSVSGAPLSLSTGGIPVTASLGVAVVTEGFFALDDLLERMHRLLAESKEKGKNRVSYGLGPASDGETGIEGTPALSTAAELLRQPDRFIAAAQPILRLEGQQVVGYELLSRSTVEGFQMPDDFFRVSLEANILTVVDLHCLRTCVAGSRGLAAGVWCHVNLFPSTLMGLPVEHLLDLFADGGAGRVFCVELSEQQIIGDPSHLVAPVKALKRAGIRVALDDVGFGRSCLESLILLEPDAMKIDKKWVSGIAEDRVREHSLRQLLKVAASLGIQTIAEGIETAADLERLRAMGIEYGQGFLWGRPQPVGDTNTFVSPE